MSRSSTFVVKSIEMRVLDRMDLRCAVADRWDSRSSLVVGEFLIERPLAVRTMRRGLGLIKLSRPLGLEVAGYFAGTSRTDPTVRS